MSENMWKVATTALLTAITAWTAAWLTIGTGKADAADVSTNTTKIESLQDTVQDFHISTSRTLGRLEAKLDTLIAQEAHGNQK